MATTGELRAIIADLELVDEGDAASYLGEEDLVAEAFEAETSGLTEADPSTCTGVLCSCTLFG